MILNRENLRKLPIILKGRRKKAGITQTKLAERIGDCSNIAISRVEHGRYIPSLGVLIDWCDSLGLELVIRERRNEREPV